MKKIGFILMAGALLMAVSCTPSKGKLCDLAKESLEQSLYYPKQSASSLSLSLTPLSVSTIYHRKR